MNYRQGIESDLSEVLQTDRIFTNVSKGEFAKSSDLKKAFGTSDEVEVCKLILQKGQIQISELERSAYLENTLREVAVMISEKCMNPLSHRPYTVETIRNAMKEAEVRLICFVLHLRIMILSHGPIYFSSLIVQCTPNQKCEAAVSRMHEVTCGKRCYSYSPC